MCVLEALLGGLSRNMRVEGATATVGGGGVWCK
jgi:hypothetical protein